MIDHILFWLSGILVLVGVVVFLFLCLMALGAWGEFKVWLRHARCPHLTYRENRACHGICQKCGKDLGFIQPLREDMTRKEV